MRDADTFWSASSCLERPEFSSDFELLDNVATYYPKYRLNTQGRQNERISVLSMVGLDEEALSL